MSDESAVNGSMTDVDVVVAANEHDDSTTTNQTIQKLMQKLSISEQQNQQLINDKEHKIKQLEDQIQTSESDKKALTSIAARAAELETEVSRLQHDLISSMSEAHESNGELSELKRVVEELKKSDTEKKTLIDAIEKERNLLLERLDQFKEKLNESEREIERLKDEEDYKTKIIGREDEIHNLNRTVDELRSEVANNRADTEGLEKEKEELEMKKNELELKIDELKKDLESYEEINGVVKEKRKVDWVVVAASAGAVALIGVVYIRYAKF